MTPEKRKVWRMKATHIDYLHSRHLRVVDGEMHDAFGIGRGHYKTDAVCMAPSHSQYAKLNKPGLPKYDPFEGQHDNPEVQAYLAALAILTGAAA